MCYSNSFSVSAGAKVGFYGSAASRIHLPAGDSVLPTMTLSASCKVSWAHPQDEGKGFCAAKRLCRVARLIAGKRDKQGVLLVRAAAVMAFFYSPVGGMVPLQGALRAGWYVAAQCRYLRRF